MGVRSVLRRPAFAGVQGQVPARNLAWPWPALTLDHVWLAATLTCAFLVTLRPADSPDYWWTVKLGEYFLDTVRMPPQDWLTFTATRTPFIEQRWLADILLAIVHRAAGLEGALLLRAVLQTLVTAGLFFACRRTGAGAPAAAIACLLAVPLIAGGTTVRPQLLAVPLFLLFLLGTTVWCERRWTLVALPLAMVVWANIHGSFPLGLALVGIALVGRGWEIGRAHWRTDEQLRYLVLLVAVCLAAPLVNPFGLDLFTWLFDYTYMTANPASIGLPAPSTEWLPTSLATIHGKAFFVSVLVLAVVLVRVGPRSPADSLRLLFFGVLALQSVRSTLWWALVMAPMLAWGLSQWTWARRSPAPSSASQRAGVPALNALIVGGLLAIAVLSLPWFRPAGLLFTLQQWPIADPTLPVALGDEAAKLSATRIYAHVGWGGYLDWRLAPRQRLFWDVRTEPHPPEVIRDYVTIAFAQPNWGDLLAAYDIDALILDRREQRSLIAAIEATGTWQAVYCDQLGAIYLPRARATNQLVSCVPITAVGS
jgi:hypothetical protein